MYWISKKAWNKGIKKSLVYFNFLQNRKKKKSDMKFRVVLYNLKESYYDFMEILKFDPKISSILITLKWGHLTNYSPKKFQSSSKQCEGVTLNKSNLETKLLNFKICRVWQTTQHFIFV